MWLLKTEPRRETRAFELEEFYGDIPRYAILSHRWERGEEVTFDNISKSPEHLKGYHKIKRFCERARKDGFEYVWADTCCIDKRSSAELNEAINSMYRWYERAAICYVYLSDVDGRDDLSRSAWFTRGWTLQELLAPTDLVFFNKAWACIASRQDLAAEIERITGIPSDALKDFRACDYCIAMKMSWSAHRKTTREEDRAYSLLGIFNINMPLLYGEGEKAFQRLQEEMMRVNTDLSLFLWHGRPCNDFGMLAADPSCFSDAPLPQRSDPYLFSNGWVTNNGGIHIQAHIEPYALTNDGAEIFFLHLHQSDTERMRYGYGIFVQRETRGREDSIYRRVRVDGKDYLQLPGYYDPDHPPLRRTLRQLCIARKPLKEYQLSDKLQLEIGLSFDQLLTYRFHQRPLDDTYKEVPIQDWPVVQSVSTDCPRCSISIRPTSAIGVFGCVVVTIVNGLEFLFCFAFNNFFQTICIAVPFWERMPELGPARYRKLRSENIFHAYHKLHSHDTQQDHVLHEASKILIVRGADARTASQSTDRECYLRLFNYRQLYDPRKNVRGPLLIHAEFNAYDFTRTLAPNLIHPVGKLDRLKLRDVVEQLQALDPTVITARMHLFFKM